MQLDTSQRSIGTWSKINTCV